MRQLPDAWLDRPSGWSAAARESPPALGFQLPRKAEHRKSRIGLLLTPTPMGCASKITKRPVR
nr:MAG TPA: hypothetical protein [Caudoviricetes sp.]